MLLVYFDGPWGGTQPRVDCLAGQHAIGFWLQIEPLNGDNTGMNGLKLRQEITICSAG